MRLVAASTQDYIILTVGLDGAITSFNSGAERIFGYAEAEVIGRPYELIFVPEDRAAGTPADEQRRAREDGRAEDERWHLRKDGSRFYCSGVLTPLRGSGGGLTRLRQDRPRPDRPPGGREEPRRAALARAQPQHPGAARQ